MGVPGGVCRERDDRPIGFYPSKVDVYVDGVMLT